MNKFERGLAIGLMTLLPGAAMAEDKILQNHAPDCQSCHQKRVDSPSGKEVVRIGEQVIQVLRGRGFYEFFHDHSKRNGGNSDIIYGLGAGYSGEITAAFIKDAHEGGKSVLITQTKGRLVHALERWLVEKGENLSPQPDVTFAPPSQHYQNAIDAAQDLQ